VSAITKALVRVVAKLLLRQAEQASAAGAAALSQLVRSDSGPSFANSLRTERAANGTGLAGSRELASGQTGSLPQCRAEQHDEVDADLALLQVVGLEGQRWAAVVADCLGDLR
jgi:hypothetical protein